MKKNFVTGLVAVLAMELAAAEYSYDFREAEAGECAAPVVRTASMAFDEPFPAFAVGDSLDLRLFADKSLTLDIAAKPPAGIAGQSYIAHTRDSSAPAVVKATAGMMRVTIDDFENRRVYSLRVKDGWATIVERETPQSDADACGTCGGNLDSLQTARPDEESSGPDEKPRRILSASDDAFETAAHKSVVDILVAFDKGSARWLENGNCADADTIEEFADYAVAKMNMVLEKSLLADELCYRLAGVATIDDAWSAIDAALLESVRLRKGRLAKLETLRERCGADTITLLVDRTSGTTSGIGFEYSGNAGKTIEYFGKMNYACNVCDIKTVYGRYTMSHETGHNMGCGHSNRQGSNSGPGRYADSCGYHFTDANMILRHTVMAYAYTSPASGDYLPIPYFSSPDITPAEYGRALGVEGTNDNRRTLQLTHAEIAGLREHVLPYDWDARIYEGDREMFDGDFLEYSAYGNHTLTLAHANADATIYYTIDGTEPDGKSPFVQSGGTIAVNLEEKTILKACAVIDGIAQSTRTVTLQEGIVWSGEAGHSGNGRWTADQNVRAWDDGQGPFEKWAACVFPDIAQNASPTVTVEGAIAPWSLAFTAADTAYTFESADGFSSLTLRDAAFAPSGDVTFNVPVKLYAVAFTNRNGRALTFNAPFGQSVDAANGYCTNLVTIGPYGKMTVAPGAGKTQTFDTLNNRSEGYAGSSVFRVGKGTVVFKGGINGGAGVIGRTQLEVGEDGNLVFDQGGGTGYSMNNTSLTVEKGGTVKFNQMEHLCRKLILAGGKIYAKRLDLMGNPGVAANGDSSIENNGGGYILVRDADAAIEVGEGATLELNVGTQTDGRTDTSGWGIVKTGKGTLAANVELKHSGATVVSNGTLAVGYSSGATVHGQAWNVAKDAALRIESGCSLKLAGLRLDNGAKLTLPAGTSAPLAVNGDVDLADVCISLNGAGDLKPGASYPLIAASGSFSGIKSLVREEWPELSNGLEWEVMAVSGVLTATVVDLNPGGDDEPDAPETPATVDVLVAYDCGAQTYVGNKGQTLKAFALRQIALMNDVLATNRLDRFYVYRLAGVCKVDGTYTNIDTAPALAANGEGAMTSLRAAREMYGADTVTLLVDTTGATLGNSSPLSSADNVAGQHECAFSVCSIRAVDTGKQHTMIHENAHNMGCGHARAQSIVNSPFKYGRGYYFNDNGVTRHTIMAYGGDNDASWYFSTSSDSFGFKLGDENNDNARVLRETCAEVALWREAGAIDLDGSFADFDAVWQTGRKYPWTVESGTVRSFNRTDYTCQCTTPLRATVAGPARLEFRHRSYFGGRSAAENDYSHFDVLLDDSPVLSQTEYAYEWTDAAVEIPEGSHEVTFVFAQRYAMNNPMDNKDVTPLDDDAVWLKDFKLVATAGTTLVIPAGETCNLTDVDPAIETITGEGTLYCGSGLPSKDYGLASGAWKGTVAFDGFAGTDNLKDFRFELYGNKDSKIQLTNCRIPFLKNNNAAFPGTLVLMDDEEHHAALWTGNGYSSNYNTFGALEGDGSMSFSGAPQHAYVFENAADFSGSITVGAASGAGGAMRGRRVVFGKVSSASDLPGGGDKSAAITVKPGAVASIGAGASWTAYNGVDIAGTLIVKGAGASLDCNNAGTLKLLLEDGATIRFDSDDATLDFANTMKFESGTVVIALGDGASPSKRRLATWKAKPSGGFRLAGYDGKWTLSADDTGLSLVKVKPPAEKRFDIPGCEFAWIEETPALQWLEGSETYSDFIEWNVGATWQDFMDASGPNGCKNWRNFLLGYPADNSTRTFRATVEMNGGEVTVTTTEGDMPEGLGLVKKLYRADDLKGPWSVEAMDSRTKTFDASRGKGFFRAEIVLEE